MKKENKISDWLVDWLKRYTLLSAVFGSIAYAIYTINDTNVMANHIGDYSFYVKVSTYLLIGAWGGLALMALIFRVFGKYIDEKYEGLEKKNLGCRSVVISGVFGAAATAISLYAYNEGKTILVGFVSSLGVITLLIFDKKNPNKKSLFIPAIAALLGGTLMVLRPGDKMLFDSIALLLLAMLALSTVDHLKKTADDSMAMGKCNYVFWRFLWLAIASSVLVLVTSYRLDYQKELLESIKYSVFNFNNLKMILVTFLFVSISSVLDIGASQEVNVSTIAIVTALKGFFVFVATVLSHIALSREVYKIPAGYTWVTMIIGSALVIFAAYMAKLTAEKAKNH